MAPSSRGGILGGPTNPGLSPMRHRGATRGRIALRVFRACRPRDGREPLRPALLPVSTARLLRAHQIASRCVCVGGPAWSKAQGSESCPVGVRRFKSCPTHRAETKRRRRSGSNLVRDLDRGSGSCDGNSRGRDNDLNSGMESVGGGHPLERDSCGGSPIKSVVELPARRGIGLAAMAAYHRAADLRTGFLIHPALGLGAPALTIALGITFVVDRTSPATSASFAYVAAALSAAHVLATTRAAPNLLRLRSGISEEAILADIYGGFTRWQTVRALLQIAAFVAVVLSLASLQPVGP